MDWIYQASCLSTVLRWSTAQDSFSQADDNESLPLATSASFHQYLILVLHAKCRVTFCKILEKWTTTDLLSRCKIYLLYHCFATDASQRRNLKYVLSFLVKTKCWFYCFLFHFYAIWNLNFIYTCSAHANKILLHPKIY